MARPNGKGKTCVYCGAAGRLTIDHVVPVSRWREFGVARRVLDNKSNRVKACIACNAEKGKMSPREWFELHPEYKARFEKQVKYISDGIKRIAGILQETSAERFSTGRDVCKTSLMNKGLKHARRRPMFLSERGLKDIPDE